MPKTIADCDFQPAGLEYLNYVKNIKIYIFKPFNIIEKCKLRACHSQSAGVLVFSYSPIYI
jgi:hypothetical protein